MKWALPLLVVTATACPGGGNPDKLYLALRGSETRVQLTPAVPPAY